MVRLRVKKDVLPPRPVEKLSEQHWSLVETMCASEASKRVTISSVVYKLQEFIEQQDQLVSGESSALGSNSAVP